MINLGSTIVFCCSFIVVSPVLAQFGLETPYYAIPKDIRIKPVLPNGAPTDPPDPTNQANQPTEMDTTIQYEVFQTYCDLQNRGIMPMNPSRNFDGLIGATPNDEPTAPIQVVSSLPALVPPAPFTGKFDLNKTPMTLQSQDLAMQNTKGEHTFESSMAGGPIIDMGAGELIYEEIDQMTQEVVLTKYRVRVIYQTPAPEYLVSDLNDGYEYDQVFRYSIYATDASSGTGAQVFITKIDVPTPWRRGAKYVEVYWEKGWNGPGTSIGSASYAVWRRSKKAGQSTYNTHDPFTDPGTQSTGGYAYPQPCHAVGG